MLVRGGPRRLSLDGACSDIMPRHDDWNVHRVCCCWRCEDAARPDDESAGVAPLNMMLGSVVVRPRVEKLFLREAAVTLDDVCSAGFGAGAALATTRWERASSPVVRALVAEALRACVGARAVFGTTTGGAGAGSGSGSRCGAVVGCG